MIASLSRGVRTAAVVVLFAGLPASALASASWEVQRSNRRLQLTGVSCVGRTACMAVGWVIVSQLGVGYPTAEGWDGLRWSAEPVSQLPRKTDAYLDGVSCTRSACVAVGSYNGSALAERFVARRWVIQHPPSPVRPASLESVSCVSPRDCTAVGSTGELGFPGLSWAPLLERFDGKRWRVQRVVLPAQITEASQYRGAWLSSVSCASSSACVAVGGYQMYLNGITTALFAEQWDGVSWSFHMLPAPASSGTLSGAYGVSCSSATACTVVGNYNLENPSALLNPPPSAFTERWDGTTWSAQSIPDPPGETGAELLAVSCPAANACTAVGWTVGSTHRSERTLVEHWTGTRWNIQSSPNPHRSLHPFLLGISCTSATACTATGGYGAVLGSFLERYS